jgi:hypothetical protein
MTGKTTKYFIEGFFFECLTEKKKNNTDLISFSF